MAGKIYENVQTLVIPFISEYFRAKFSEPTLNNNNNWNNIDRILEKEHYAELLTDFLPNLNCIALNFQSSNSLNVLSLLQLVQRILIVSPSVKKLELSLEFLGFCTSSTYSHAVTQSFLEACTQIEMFKFKLPEELQGSLRFERIEQKIQALHAISPFLSLVENYSPNLLGIYIRFGKWVNGYSRQLFMPIRCIF